MKLIRKNPSPGQVFFCRGSSQIETFQKLAAIANGINIESIFPSNIFAELRKDVSDFIGLESCYREPTTLSKSKNIFENIFNIGFMLMST